MKRKSKRKIISIGSIVLVSLFFLANKNSRQFVLFPADPIITDYQEHIHKKNAKYKK